MSDINGFFKSAPDLLRSGMSQEQMAKLLARMMMIGAAMSDKGDEREASDNDQTDPPQS